jgi:non-specific serine/threonine protein kinase
VLSLLLVLKRARAASSNADANSPSLLIVPTSLITNWRSEIQKFASSLGVFYAHPSETPNEELAAAAKSPVEALGGKDLVITSYFDGCSAGLAQGNDVEPRYS